jgi:glutathione S-transferase
MATLQIIGSPQSNYVWLTRIVCTEKGVPYELVSARPRSPEVNAIHPFGRIPCMRHGDLTLCESRAICAYIDRAFEGPSLVPADPAGAARVEQWVSLVNTTMDPVLIRRYLIPYVFPGTPDRSPDRARIDAALPEVERHLDILNRAVAGGHVAGDAFTLADANLVPILFYIRRMPEAGTMIRARPALDAYVSCHIERPSVRATMPEIRT